MTEQELINILKQLAQAREEYEKNRATITEISGKYNKLLNADAGYIIAVEKAAGAKDAIERLEAEAKQMGVDLYKANPAGGKALVGGNVNIKNMIPRCRVRMGDERSTVDDHPGREGSHQARESSRRNRTAVVREDYGRTGRADRIEVGI